MSENQDRTAQLSTLWRRVHRLNDNVGRLQDDVNDLKVSLRARKRAYDGCELVGRIERAMLACLTREGGLSPRVVRLDQAVNALDNPAHRRHASVRQAVERVKVSHPWTSDLADFAEVVRNAIMPVDEGDYGRALHVFAKHVMGLDAGAYPTKDAFATWLVANQEEIVPSHVRSLG